MRLNQAKSSLLLADRLSFAFGDRPILKDVSLSIGPGEFVGLIGVNGSGKSTLLRLLLGLLPAASGEARLCGEPARSLKRREIALRATMVSQDTRIDFEFTAREIVAMGRAPYRGRFAAETSADREAIRRAMLATDTERFAERLVSELSGGERQRVHLARALAQDTPAVLLDEPTANLDLAHQIEALRLLDDATRQGKAALVALHDLALAARFCRRLLLLAGGEIVADGQPDEVVTEDNLSKRFGLPARVRRDDETGSLQIVPLADRPQSSGPKRFETSGMLRCST